jgi:hypothetical protein
MNITKDGKIEIDISDWLDHLTEKKKLELIETLSCQEDIIKHVADQILTGWTENAFHGLTGFGIEPRTALELARQRVVELAPEVAQTEIDRLKRFAKNQEEIAKKYEEKYFALYEAWPNGYIKPAKGF